MADRKGTPGCNVRGPRNVSPLTLGCKINQYDTNTILAGAKALGHAVVDDPAQADVIVVNTCTVTGRTDYKGRQLIRRAAERNPEAVLIVTGCYAQVEPERIAEIDGVDYVLGNAEKRDIPGLLAVATKQSRPRIRVGEVRRERRLDSGPTAAHSGTTRAFVKIQDGCSQGCAYCIIPQARGRSRSLPREEVRSKVELLASQGFREVVLCGIHLGWYGRDLEPRTSLRDLLAELDADAPVSRIRVSSVEPNEMDGDLIALFANARRLCPHFHLPLQSGDAGVLEAMRRPYTPSAFVERVRSIRRAVPDAAVGIDLIAGFPGETEEAFGQTCALLETLPLSYFHVFPYSPRPGTPAARHPHPVPPEVVHRRAGILRRIGRGKRQVFHEGFLGRELEVLVESRRDPETRLLRGVSRNYLNVFFDGPDALQGSCVPVRVESAEWWRVFGETRPEGVGLNPPKGA